VTEAWIGFVGAVFAGLLSAWVAVRQSRMDERLTHINHDLDARLTRLNHDLDHQLHERDTLFDRSMAAEDVLTRYREPLAAAAYDLQSRLYNILRMDFFNLYGGDNPRAEEAVMTTLFRFAQYFGWTEILRRDIQFLSFPTAEETTSVIDLQWQVSQCFLTHSYGQAMMIWGDEQRALGEQMIVEQYGKVLCMGYGTFRGQCGTTFAPWLERIRAEVRDETAAKRMLDAQHALCKLVETLDHERIRYTKALDRA
jgi:hypothetical protein